MFLNARHIGTSVDWLTHHATPPVRYLTHKYILDDDPESANLNALYNDVLSDDAVTDIFGKQQSDGSWCAGGGWAPKPSYKPQEGYEPTTPKYVTTAWILPLLGEMGIDRRDAKVRRAANYLLTHQWPNGFLASHHGPHARQYAETGTIPVTPCHFAIYLWAFASAGMAADPQLKKSFDLLVSWQRDDGGWLDARHKDGTAAPYKVWDRSCPWSTHYAALALYHAGLPEYKEALNRALKFLIGHLAAKNETDIRQLYYHGHNTVKELLMFAETGVGLDSRPVQVLLEWLLSMYNEKKGVFKYNGKPISKYSAKTDGVSPRVMKYRTYHLLEDDWLTYYGTRIGKALLTIKEASDVAVAE